MHWNPMLVPHLLLLQLLRTVKSLSDTTIIAVLTQKNIFVAKAYCLQTHATGNSYMYMYMYIPCRYKVSRVFP